MSRICRLGIIGAENSHSYKIAEVCNVLEKVPLRVTHIWGETKEFAATAARRGGIPEIVSDWKSLLGKVDGVMIDQRHGADHGEVARYFIEAGIPTFVDKPLTCNLTEAREILHLAERRGCPVTTFSSKPLQKAFQAKLAEIGRDTVTVLSSSGPADIKSKYGGIFFYGIHQVDCAVEVFGTGALNVSVHRGGTNAIATIEFSSGRLASLSLIAGHQGGFRWLFCTDHGDFVLPDKNDRLPYLNSARLVSDFLKTGTSPFTVSRMLAPVAILEALQTACESGGKVAVDPV